MRIQGEVWYDNSKTKGFSILLAASHRTFHAAGYESASNHLCRSMTLDPVVHSLPSTATSRLVLRDVFQRDSQPEIPPEIGYFEVALVHLKNVVYSRLDHVSTRALLKLLASTFYPAVRTSIVSS